MNTQRDVMTTRPILQDLIAGIARMSPRISPEEGARIFVFLAVFVVFHFYHLANFSISIDDEYAIWRRNPDIWVAQGRFVTYLVETLLGSQVMPFVPLALFGGCLVFGYVFLLRALRIGVATPIALACFPLFAAFPTWDQLTAFQSNTPSAGLAVLCCGFAAWLFRVAREGAAASGWLVGGPAYVAISLLGAVATGSYQSFILFEAVALLLVVLSLGAAGRRPAWLARDLAAALAVLAVGLMLYLAIQMLVFEVLNASSGGSLRKETSYILNFIRLSSLLDSPRLVVEQTARQAAALYCGFASAYGVAAPAFGALVLLVAVAAVVAGGRADGRRGALLAAAAVVAVLAMPFAINLMSGGAMPVRSLVAVPLVLAGLGLVGLPALPSWGRRGGFVVLGAAYLTMMVVSGRFNTLRHLIQIHDQQMAAALAERFAPLVDPARLDRPVRIDVFGGVETVLPYDRAHSTLGSSFFSNRSNNISRIISYMRLLGYNVAADPLAHQGGFQRLDRFIGMPSWPAEGAVRREGDVILVKFSDVSNQHLSDLQTQHDPSQSRPPFYRMAAVSRDRLTVLNADAPPDGEGGMLLNTRIDSQIIFTPGAADLLARCRRLEVHARLKVERRDVAQMFFQKPGQRDFSEEASLQAEVAPAAEGGFTDLYFQLSSEKGFRDVLRFDPVQGRQQVRVGDVELSCLRSIGD